jgi:hypothetical protein
VNLGLFVQLGNFHAGVAGTAFALDIGFLHRPNMRLRQPDTRAGQPCRFFGGKEKAPVL